MPKFIGTDFTMPVVSEPPKGFIRLTSSQVKVLMNGYDDATYAEQIKNGMVKVLDTTDRGGPHSLAKRWWRYYASADVIRNCPTSTDNMLRKAGE